MSPLRIRISGEHRCCKGAAWFLVWHRIAIYSDPAPTLLRELCWLAAWFLAHCYRESYWEQDEKKMLNMTQVSAKLIRSTKPQSANEDNRTKPQLANEDNRSFGYSSLKSRDIRSVHSFSFRIFATISLPCHLPHHNYSTASDTNNESIIWSTNQPINQSNYRLIKCDLSKVLRVVGSKHD